MIQQRQLSRSYTTGPVSQLEIDLANARLVIRGEERQDVQVQVSLAGDSPELDLDEVIRQAEAAIRQDGAKVTIREPDIALRGWQFGRAGVNLAVSFSQGFRFGHASVVPRFEYELRVPRETEARIRSGNGAIDLAALNGPVRIETGNGPVNIEDVEHDLQVASENSHVTIKHCGAGFSATSENGTIRVERVKGPAVARSENGRLVFRELSAGLQAETENGRIEYEGDILGDFSLSTENGGITLTVPAGSRFELDAESRHGSVSCDLPVREQRPISEESMPKIHLRSGNGSIRIKELTLPAVTP
jgi:hypothetical protein